MGVLNNRKLKGEDKGYEGTYKNSFCIYVVTDIRVLIPIFSKRISYCISDTVAVHLVFRLSVIRKTSNSTTRSDSC